MSVMIQSLAKPLRHISLFRSTGIILFLLFILSETVTLPGFILTILALLWILYIPFSIGDLFVAIPIKPIKSLSNYINGVGVFDVLIKWFIGLLLIILFAFPASISHLFIANILGPILLLMAIPLNFVLSRNKKTEVKKVDKQIIIKILVFSLILGISFGTFIRFFSPYPLTPGFDTFSHMYVIKSFLNGSVDTNTVVYLPTFHLLVALGSATFNADVIEIFWTASIILSSLFAVSLYAMSYWVSRNHMIAFVGTFIGLAITEMGMSPNIQVFVPSSFVMSIFPITFLVVDVIWKRSNTNKRLPIILTLVVFTGLVLIHYELGLAAAFVLSSYLLSLYYISKNDFLLILIRIATISIAVILFLYLWGYFTFQLQLQNIFNQSHMIDYTYLYNTATKIIHLDQWYTLLTASLSILGLITLSMSVERRAVILSFITSILFFVYFQQISVIQRIMTLERPLLSFAAAVLIMIPTFHLLKRPYFHRSQKNHSYGTKQKSESKMLYGSHNHDSKFKPYWLGLIILSRNITKWSTIYITIVSILLFPVLMKPYELYISGYAQHGDTFINFTGDELNAAKWIEKNTPRDYLVFSDPFTVIEMKGLAFRQNIPAIGWNITVAKLVKSAMTAEDASNAYDKILSNFGKKVIIVINPRTTEWLKTNNLNLKINPDTYFVMFPTDKFQGFGGFDNFFNKKYFKLEYKSRNTFVFALNGNDHVNS